MKVLNYSDLTDISKQCESGDVVLDLKLFDIPSTMRRNIKKCAELGAVAVTVAENVLNYEGILVALKSGKEYGIEIIIGTPQLTRR